MEKSVTRIKKDQEWKITVKQNLSQKCDKRLRQGLYTLWKVQYSDNTKQL